MAFMDDLWGGLMRVAKLAVILVALVILGGVLAGLTDALMGGMTAGTPFGPESTVSPLLWTVVAGAVVWGANEVLR